MSAIRARSELARLLFLAGIITSLAVTAKAVNLTNLAELRIGAYETSPVYYQEYGYNAAILGDLTQLANFDGTYPGVIPESSALRKRIEMQRKKFEEASAEAGRLGIAAVVGTDEPTLPIPILDRMGNPDSAAKLSVRIDLEDERYWAAHRAKYREVLKAYPQIAYVIVRTGENYSHSDQGYAGRTVRDGVIDDAYFRHMQRLIEETRKIVVDEFGRTLIWRTWDLGNDGFHANPRVYDRILAGLPSRKGLMFAVKFTQTDFWRYNDFNPMIGRGGTDQVIEFQCAREYEGKGAFPDYVGPIHAAALRQAATLGVKNAWVWDFGGGWGGPFLKSDRWVRLNIFATSRLAQNPDLTPRALAEQWAAKEFGPKSAANVAEMLMISGECVRKFMYIEAFARDHHGWKPSLNLMRDDIIRGEVLRQLYDGSKGSLPEVFAEKEEAVALAGRMRMIFESAHADIAAERGEEVYQDALSSLIYQESLAKVICHYVNGMFLYYQWQDAKSPAVAVRAREELQAWSKAWASYQADVPKLPGVATLYRSQNAQDAASAKGAMADLCQQARRALSTAMAGSKTSAQQAVN